jgi:hypothetical protein
MFNKPGTLILVFGKHKGVVVKQGPDGTTCVEYRNCDTGTRVRAYVADTDVEARK